jgi:hypothetical protein
LFRVKEHAGLREIIVRDKYVKGLMLDDYAKGGKTTEDKEGTVVSGISCDGGSSETRGLGLK